MRKTLDESDEESQIEIDVDDDDVANPLIPSSSRDVDLEDEVGFGLVMMVRGRSTGRRVKRDLCCFGVFQFICGVAIGAIADAENKNYSIAQFFANSEHGKDMIGIMEMVATLSILMSILTFALIRYWSSLVTNRTLLSGVLKIYVGICFAMFIIVLAVMIVVFQTFGEVPRWGVGVNNETNNMLPHYICTVLFMFPYLLCVCRYGMNISYLNEEVEMGGNITEPGAVNSMDMSGMSISECCQVIVTFPLAVIYQLFNFGAALYFAGKRMFVVASRFYEEKKEERAAAREAKEAAKAKKGRSFFRRLRKTLNRWRNKIPGLRDPPVPPYMPDPGIDEPASSVLTQGVTKEQQERLERERKAEEAERALKRQRDAEEDERRRQEEEERRRKSEEEAKRRLKELEEEEKRLAELEEPQTLNTQKFKELWTTLPTSGSFQCKLKSLPEMKGFCDHLKKQGFHVAYAAIPKEGDIEVGLSNIREDRKGPWFIARLLTSGNSFSAVMKAEDPEIVPTYVKKFALAKVLKITTGK